MAGGVQVDSELTPASGASVVVVGVRSTPAAGLIAKDSGHGCPRQSRLPIACLRAPRCVLQANWSASQCASRLEKTGSYSKGIGGWKCPGHLLPTRVLEDAGRDAAGSAPALMLASVVGRMFDS